MKKYSIYIILISIISAFFSCGTKSIQSTKISKDTIPPFTEVDTFHTLRSRAAFIAIVQNPVRIGEYFQFMDTLVAKYDSLLPYSLNEHLLVRANPWILDTLESTDYYRMMAKGQFVYNQKKLVVLKKNDTLLIPDAVWANEIIQKQQATIIDVNIPEYKLRIIENGKVLNTFSVRVGRNERKYLELARKLVDLRTQSGQGEIIRINKNPIFINPSNGRRFSLTRRDDGKTTVMPLIPWLEPSIGGVRIGQLIHPTTNLKTLGKAYSNGCVGASEADAWRIYYYAPIGTRVHFRYDLIIEDEKGDTTELKDIYKWKNKKKTTPVVAGLLFVLTDQDEVLLLE